MSNLLFKGAGFDAVAIRDGQAISPYVRKTRPLPYRSGNVHVITLGEGETAVRVVSQPINGRVTVAPDGTTLHYVLTDTYVDAWKKTPDDDIFDRFDIEFDTVTETKQKTVVVRIGTIEYTHRTDKEGVPHGWAKGIHYVMPVGADDLYVFEPGPNHRSFYVTIAPGAWTADSIATAEGLTPADITASWIVAQEFYGCSEAEPLEPNLGRLAAREAIDQGSGSVWYLMERGQTGEYTLGGDMFKGKNGHSPLHPLFHGAWGRGSRPVIDQTILLTNNTISFHAYQSFGFHDACKLLAGSASKHHYIVLEDLFAPEKADYNIQGSKYLTQRKCRSDFAWRDVATDAPTVGWGSKGSRISPWFVSGSEDLLMQDIYVDHGGWADGYSYDGDITQPQAPSFYSHDLYLQGDNADITLDGVMTSRPAFSNQTRSGGTFKDFITIDQGLSHNSKKGAGDPPADYIQSIRTVNIGSRRNFLAGGSDGANGQAFQISSEANVFYQCMNINYVDPQNPTTEEGDPTVINKPADWTVATNATCRGIESDITGDNARFQNILQYNRKDNAEIIPADFDITNINEATIFDFAAQAEYLGYRPTNSKDWHDYVRGLDKPWEITRDLVRFLYSKVGIDLTPRTVGATCIFTPSSNTEGQRWDVLLNWSTNDIPGTAAGDSVDLRGNKVRFCLNVPNQPDSIALSGGHLFVTGGFLRPVNPFSDGGAITVEHSGQLTMHGTVSADPIDVLVDKNGRLRFEGANTDLDLTVNSVQEIATVPCRPEVLMENGSALTIASGRSLTIEGPDASIGADGPSGSASLTIAAGGELRFVASDDGLSTLANFTSGITGVDPDTGKNVASETALSVDLSGDLVIDLTAYAGTISGPIVQADSVTGTPKISVIGLGARDATVTINSGSVDLVMIANGGGQVRMEDGRV